VRRGLVVQRVLCLQRFSIAQQIDDRLRELSHRGGRQTLYRSEIQDAIGPGTDRRQDLHDRTGVRIEHAEVRITVHHCLNTFLRLDDRMAFI
jgi:hypothetical protein